MQFKVKYFYLKVCDNRMTEHLKTPDTVIDYIKGEFDYNEKIIVLGLNIKNRIVIKRVVAMGGYNTIMCVPADIFIPLLKCNARNFILVHNHPSSDCSPSKEDVIFTKKVEKASQYVGLQFLDHLIYTPDDYYSFKKNGAL